MQIPNHENCVYFVRGKRSGWGNCHYMLPQPAREFLDEQSSNGYNAKEIMTVRDKDDDFACSCWKAR